MEPSKPTNPLLSLSTFIHQNCLRLGADFSTRLDETTRAIASNLSPVLGARRLHATPFFASVSQQPKQGAAAAAAAATLSSEHVAKTLSGTCVYTVSNSNNEFVLISDPDGAKSISLLCFRHEDAEAFLAQVRLRRRELRSQAKIVPITLDQLKATATKGGFDGVPVFQSDLLVVKKKNKRYCPIYFQKEDIEKELSKVSKASRGPGVSQHIMVGSLEDVLRKMEISEKNSGWEDMIFIPPGKSHSQHIQEVANV
ncbi:protein TIC 22, chloroplastic isoform X2 [Mercurialis annua]|uniref:protein TIC 22, chloroplastic isoform X2 n=1 Tax=Mercurialis annua TaxID=3986 RepID=UPI00215E0C60|nr:protein TIC 22, chloroplastic isoform X2 [Mercurialis annua]